MKAKHLSKFFQKPKTKLGWWVFGLGLPVLFIGPILGLFASVIRPLLDEGTSELIGQISGIVIVLLLIVDIILTTFLGIIAIKKGERSWAFWVGFISAVLAVLFLAFMIIGEFIFPH